MKTYFLFIITFSCALLLSAQDINPEFFGLESGVIVDKELGTINYYLTADESKTSKPLLVYLDGSGHYPLFQKMDGGLGSSVLLDLESLKKEYRILLISKPGIPFVDEMNLSPNGYPEYEEPKTYTERLSLYWRVDAADLIINKLTNEKTVDASQVVVLGFSEGAQVGPYLAQKNKHISHLLLFAGNGLNQFFDFLITARQKALRGEITEVEAQTEIDSLYQVYGKIYAAPENTTDYWYGHTYQRWASFTQTDPVDVLVELDIPIYIANGSLDENSVLSADYIYLEFLRKRKTNLTYKTYPGYDHQFNELIFKDGQVIDAKPQLDKALEAAYEWLKNKKS